MSKPVDRVRFIFDRSVPEDLQRTAWHALENVFGTAGGELAGTWTFRSRERLALETDEPGHVRMTFDLPRLGDVKPGQPKQRTDREYFVDFIAALQKIGVDVKGGLPGHALDVSAGPLVAIRCE